jgi:glycosyltransferase involved in cell wall biosynthesis
MITLLDDKQTRLRMSALGKERASREFRWESEREKLVGAYDRLLD